MRSLEIDKNALLIFYSEPKSCLQDDIKRKYLKTVIFKVVLLLYIYACTSLIVQLKHLSIKCSYM